MKKVELEISMLKDKKDKVQTTNFKLSSFICIMDHFMECSFMSRQTL